LYGLHFRVYRLIHQYTGDVHQIWLYY
jgi:hypothetical protein